MDLWEKFGMSEGIAVLWQELGISAGTAIAVLIALYFVIKWGGQKWNHGSLQKDGRKEGTGERKDRKNQ